MSAFIKSLTYEAHQSSPLRSTFGRAQHGEIISSAFGYFQHKELLKRDVDIDHLIMRPDAVLVLSEDPVQDRIKSIAGGSLRRDQVVNAAHWFVDFVAGRAPCSAFKWEEEFLAHCIQDLALPHMHGSLVFRDALAFAKASRAEFQGQDWAFLKPLQDQHDGSWEPGAGYADLALQGMPAGSDLSMATSVGFLFEKLDRRFLSKTQMEYWFSASVTSGNGGAPTTVWQCGRTPGVIS